MITSAEIKNCQSHKNTFVEFDEGVNIFVGDTDSGKSAFLRSLRYALWNQYTSKLLMSTWGGPLHVALEIDGNKIVRESDKKEIYKLNDLTFNSFGTKTPFEIEQVVNMDSINNQEQIDSFFLLAETPGYVASYLNKLANLEEIDITTSSIKSELNSTKQRISHKKEDLNSKLKEKESFKHLSDFKKDLDAADSIQSNLTNLEIEVKVISHLIDEVTEIKNEMESANHVLSIKKFVDKAVDLSFNCDVIEAKISKINESISLLKNIDAKIDKIKKVSDLKPDIESALTLKNNLKSMGDKFETLDILTSKISDIDTRIEILQSEIAQDKDIYETELHKLGKCFFCGSKLK